MVYTAKLLGKDWLVNERFKGAEGAQDQRLGEEPHEEPIVYLSVETSDGKRYGAMHYDKVAELCKANHHAYEIIPTSRKRTFYLDFDIDVSDDGRPSEEHQRAFEDL